MFDRHLARVRARHEISPAEEEILRDLVAETRSFPADAIVVPREKELRHCTLLLDGFLSRQKGVRTGGLQVTEIMIPGDFADLHSFTLKRLDHDIVSFTPCEVALVPHERIHKLTEEQPHLTRVYWFGTNLDGAIHREWEVSLGRRTALARLAHLFCELEVRLSLVGLAQDGRYELPLTQADLAECLGLTSVHVNRTLMQLREQGLVEFRNREVVIYRLERLREVAEFDPSYLHLEKRRR
jgi:CRP-like cAMP-binding protein